MFLKRIFCKHDYWWSYNFICSNLSGLIDHQLIEVGCKCKKCGKEKSIKFKKGVDKTQSLCYNSIVRRR